MDLFKPKSEEGNSNDPVMINPKGAEVQVSQDRVIELLKKGFTLKDRTWRPQEEEVITRKVPKELEKLQEELSLKADLLEVTEI